MKRIARRAARALAPWASPRPDAETAGRAGDVLAADRAAPRAAISIAPATERDRVVLIAMTAALQDYERLIEQDWPAGPRSAEEHLDALADWVERDGGGALIAWRGGRSAVGFIVYGLEREAGPGGEFARTGVVRRHAEAPLVGRISDLFVAPEARRLGAGAALIAAAEAELAALGAERVDVTALAGNAVAREAYRRLGYEERTVTFSRPLRRGPK